MIKDRFYKSPPQIPGRIYKNKFPRHLQLLILIPSFLLYAYWAVQTSSMDTRFLESLNPTKITITAIIFFILIIATSRSTALSYVDMTEKYVTVKFENGTEIKKSPLESYAIFVSKPPSKTNSYRYRVSLAKIDSLSHTDQHFAIPIKTYKFGRFLLNTNHPLTAITLIDDIFTPANLKEWIEGFQEQISAPLPLAFESEDLRSDYETGVYQSSKK